MDFLEKYTYSLPEELIAKAPASPRDSSRLFIYNTRTDEIYFDTFKNLAHYVPGNTLLVLNDTKVVPARVFLTKPTGGKIEVLLLLNELQKGDPTIKSMVDRRAEVGWKLAFSSGETLEIMRQEEQFFFLKPSVPISELWGLISKYGETPIPRYINGGSLSETELREKYQSMFAEHPASVAAPTASLHFTPSVMETLQEKGYEDTRVTLHVGAGTFAPITQENFASKKLHREFGSISEDSAQQISRAKKSGFPVLTVGTTATRVVEAFSQESRGVTAQSGPIDLFIFPPYTFKVADILLTNFHIPKSSLMLLVDAFLKQKHARRNILDLYAIAINEKFRFYSFGDAMLIL